MSGGSSPPSGDAKKPGGFKSVRSMWQEKVKEVEGAAGPPAAPKFSLNRPSSGRTSSGSGNAPPQSPSSRATAILSQPQEASSDPFQQYGIAFFQDNTGVLAIKKVIPGSAADQAGVIFPGDALHEVNGMEVYKWPLERITPLASGDRAGATLRLSLERNGFAELINVELELGKNNLTRPSPRLSPVAAVPPPMEHAAAAAPPLSKRSPHGSDSHADSQAQDYEEYQAVAPQSSFEDTPNVKDEMRMNVVKRYKARIQELSQNLEESQVSSAQQARQVDELTRFLNEKDELLKELREAVSKLTNKLEESLRENYDMRRRMNDAAPVDPSIKAGGGDTSFLNREVQRLTTELDAMRNQRDLAQLSALPSDDTSDLLRELKLQIIEKDAKVQDLEGKIASLKRSNVIQAVELQELHDHVAGMEKQKIAMQVQQFPPLPPLQSVRESPAETPMNEDDKMKAIMLADEVLQKAQEEIALLKQKDERRVQLEMWAEQSQHEIQRLRKELAERSQSSPGAGAADSVKRERDELKVWSQKAHSEIESLQMELSRSKSQVDLLTQQLTGLDNLTVKTAEMHQINMNLETQLQVLRSQHGPPGPNAAGPMDLGPIDGSILDHPIMQNLGMLDRKQQELQQYIANMPQSLNAIADGGDASNANKVSERDDLLSWLKSRLQAVDEQLKAATQVLQKSGDVSSREVEARLQQVCADIEAISRVQPDGFKESIWVHQMSQLRAQLRGQDEALAKLTGSFESGDKSAAQQLIAETQKVESLKSKVEELLRNERLMNSELDLTKDAFAKSREQYSQAQVEIKMLRSHLGDDQHRHQHQSSSKTTEDTSAEEHSARLFESVMQEKRSLEDSLNKMRDEQNFVERCLSDARMDISRLESENEGANNSLHEAQLAGAKMEGKLQAAQTRIASLEKQLNNTREEISTLNDEVKRGRQIMIQSDSEKGLENNTLRSELQFFKDDNEKMKREALEWTSRVDKLTAQHQEQLSACEQELQKISSEKSGLTGDAYFFMCILRLLYCMLTREARNLATCNLRVADFGNHVCRVTRHEGDNVDTEKP